MNLLIALVCGSRDESAFSRSTSTFVFRRVPIAGRVGYEVDGYRLCQCDCDICHQSPEVVFVHYDCYAVFMNEATKKLPEREALDQLWLASSWNSPWRGAPLLTLRAVNPSDFDLKTLDSLLGGFKISELPSFVQREVWFHSSEEICWRMMSILRLPAIFQSSSALSVTPISKVQSWNRGDADVATFDGEPTGYIRITIDYLGILKVERLSERPPLSSAVDTRFAFIVEPVDALDGTLLTKVRNQTHISAYTPPFFFFFNIAHLLQRGLARLKLSSACPEIWDIPGSKPSDLTKIHLWPSRQIRFRSINLNAITGVTFFFVGEWLQHLFPHRDQSSYTALIMEKAAYIRNVVWVYVPITRDDPVTLFGVNQSCGKVNILVRQYLRSRFGIS